MSGYRPGMSEADILLFDAVSKGRLESARLALSRGARPGALDADGQTPLHALAQAQEPAETLGPIIGALIEAGADLEALDPAGLSPLALAARWRNLAAVSALADQGASLQGALYQASEFPGGGQVIDFLLRRGACPFEPGPSGLSPLQMARRAWGGADPACVALLEAAELESASRQRSPSASAPSRRI